MQRLKRLVACVTAAALAMALVPAAAFGGSLQTSASSTATVSYDVTYCQTSARSMLSMINGLRTSAEDAWAWDSSDSEKVYYTDLSELAYDYDLEQVAMQRAAEIALYYSHTRPDGSTCWTAYSECGVSSSVKGENIAAGYTSASAVFTAWAEEDESYSGQGHRRNMLSSSYTRVGVACVYVNGYYYWVQEFGSGSVSTTATTANDSTTTVSADITLDAVTVKSVSYSESSITLVEGYTTSVPDVTFSLRLSDSSGYTWPTSRYLSVSTSISWAVGSSSVATLSGSTLTGVAQGSTTLSATALGQELSVDVTVVDYCTAYGHSYASEITAAATCTVAGVRTYTCSTCGDTYIEEIAALGHSYDAGVVTTQATCTEAGVLTYTCSTCGDTCTEAIAATGHSYTGYVSNGDATCTADGTKTASCDNGCGATSTVTDSGSATGHSYVGTVTAPTCTDDGYTTYTCSACGDVYVADATEALGHSYVGTVTTAATSTTDGVMTYTCGTCGDSYTEVIPATGSSSSGSGSDSDGADSGGSTGGTGSSSSSSSDGSSAGSGSADGGSGSSGTVAYVTYANTMTVKASTKTVKYKKVKKAKRTFKAITVKKAKGTVTYTKKGGSKKLMVNKKTGKITVKKGTKRGIYKIKVKVKAAGTSKYLAASKIVTVTIKVK